VRLAAWAAGQPSRGAARRFGARIGQGCPSRQAPSIPRAATYSSGMLGSSSHETGPLPGKRLSGVSWANFVSGMRKRSSEFSASLRHCGRCNWRTLVLGQDTCSASTSLPPRRSSRSRMTQLRRFGRSSYSYTAACEGGSQSNLRVAPNSVSGSPRKRLIAYPLGRMSLSRALYQQVQQITGSNP